VFTLASTTTTTEAPRSTGPSFFTLLLGGLAIMFLGNLLGRYISTRTHRTLGRKLYYIITIPVMALFVFVVFALGEKMTVTLQYVVFAAYILLFSVLGGFVEVPPMPVRKNDTPAEGQPSDELSETAGTADVVEGEGKDVTEEPGVPEQPQATEPPTDQDSSPDNHS